MDAQREPWLLALVALAAWSVAPPYLGPLVGAELDVSSSVEAVDHALPGGVAIAGAAAALGLERGGRAESWAALLAIGVCVLAGLWVTVSHLSLLADAGDPARPWGAVILHASAGPPLLALSLWLLLFAPRTEERG